MLLFVRGGMAADVTPGGPSTVQRDRFGGGMSIQVGAVSIATRHGELSGVMFGLGGRLHLYIGRFMRLGSAGASVAMNYESGGRDGCYYTVGYGGVTAEASLPLRRWRFSAGALVGAGGVDNLHIVQAHEHDSVRAVLTSATTFLAAPILTVEMRVSRSISLMLMGDWFFGPGLGERHQLLGPKVHSGVLFNR